MASSKNVFNSIMCAAIITSLLAAALFLGFRDQSDVVEAKSESTLTVPVFITSQGVMPDQITIDVGDSVVWQNATNQMQTIRLVKLSNAYLPIVLSNRSAAMGVDAVIGDVSADNLPIATPDFQTWVLYAGESITYTFNSAGRLGVVTRVGKGYVSVAGNDDALTPAPTSTSTPMPEPTSTRNPPMSGFITQTASSSCDAITNSRGGPLDTNVYYSVKNTLTDSWFWAYNATPDAKIAVLLSGYTSVTGQLQVMVNSASGCGTNTLLGFVTNPNPVVVVSNVPRGNIFFRVVSWDGQTQPAPYKILWDYYSGDLPGIGIEPNNNICQATVLPERAIFTATDNDQFDFYSVSITQSGQVLTLMDGHNTAGTQVQLRAPYRYNGINEDASDAASASCPVRIATRLRKDPYVEPIGNVSSPGARVLSRAGGLVFPGDDDQDTAGVLAMPQKWYIRVATPYTGGQSNRQYTIRWVFLPPGVTTYPFTDTMTQTGPAHGSDPLLRASDPFTATAREKWYYSFFWANMDKISGGVADAIQFSISSWSSVGCPANVFPPDPSQTVPAGFSGSWVTVSNQPSGVMTWKMNKSGAYLVRFRAMRDGSVVSYDEKLLQVDCGFQTYNFGGLWPLGSDNTTPGSPLNGSEKPADWVEPIP